MAPASPERKSCDQGLARAIAHPLRRAILEHLETHIASPAELADALREPEARITYHVEVLAQCDCLELMETRTREGSCEPFYLAKPRAPLSSPELLRSPLSKRGAMSGRSVGARLERAGVRSARARELDERRTVGSVSVELDEFGRAAVGELLETFLRGIELIHAQSIERMEATGKHGGLVNITCALLELGEAPAASPEPPE
jgi:helix-turn-helix protein